MLLILGVMLSPAGAETSPETGVKAAREASMSFARELQAELKKALESGGPEAGVAVCKEAAPAIAAAASERLGGEVGRTSLNTFNPANAPDEWERKVLEAFEARKAAGEPLETLEFHEIVARDGEQRFRYMKAIGIQQPCLACHGKTIAPELAEIIKRFYPEDKGIGYDLGDIRGAFTISMPAK
jgi:hypothetical protein